MKLTQPDPWIEKSVRNIDDEIDEHKTDGNNQGEALHDNIISGCNRFKQGPAQPGQIKDGFGEDRAG